jgi:hypothetical protein
MYMYVNVIIRSRLTLHVIQILTRLFNNNKDNIQIESMYTQLAKGKILISFPHTLTQSSK